MSSAKDGEAPASVLPGAVTVEACSEEWDPCYYADNVYMLACKQRSSHMVWMCSKRASPKERACCTVCAAWLIGENLALIGKREKMVRWPIALSCGRRSLLKLIVCMNRTHEDADLDEGEIQASDLTPQGTCLGCILLFFSDHDVKAPHGFTPWCRPRKTVQPPHQSDTA